MQPQPDHSNYNYFSKSVQCLPLGYCSKVVSTIYASPDLPSCRRHQKAPLGASSGSHGIASRGHASRGHVESFAAVQVGRARPAHSYVLYAFVDGTGAFPHLGLLFNCDKGEDKGRRAASDHSGWRSNHDGHPDFVVNFSLGLWSLSACVACACTCFENLAPKYLYQLILVNFFLVLISIINHLLYLSKLVLLPVSGMSKTW